jgi:DNA mismatch repair protein MutL
VAKISVLPDHIASQIAAGEVIERPASVVKEFVENSIDAGATKIEVTISLDCRDIRVADNGCGMEADDAALAFQRHATSKLKSADDLWRLDSLGFRGEALPSIASVSHMSCTTRQADAVSGCRVQYDDGVITVTETGCAPGTVMEVTDLFYNVPARLSFLKKPATEFGHIQETVQALAVAHPHIAFTLVKQDEVVMRSFGSGDLSRVVVEVGHFTGRENLIEVKHGDAGSEIQLHGYIARPLHFRGDRKGILTVVNNRPVRCSLTYRALDYAYSDLIPRGKSPLAVMTMRINPAKVDVNVHPSKKELRYTDGNDTYITVQRAIAGALREATRHQGARVESERFAESVAYAGGSSPPRSYLVQESFVSESPSVVREGAEVAISVIEQSPAARSFDGSSAGDDSSLAAPHNLNAHFRTEQVRERLDVKQIDFVEDLRLSKAAPVARSGQPGSNVQTEPADGGLLTDLPTDWRIAGYIHNTYIFIETAEGMEIVEQHIAHERTLYERILARQTVRGRVTDEVQTFLVSHALDLSPEQKALLDENFDLLNNLGFDFKRDVDGSVAATQVPLELVGKNYCVVIQDLLDQISGVDKADLQLEATKSLACQAAVKNGMSLSPDALRKLLIDWLNTPRNDTCPHGRPIRMRYSMDRLFQIFHP